MFRLLAVAGLIAAAVSSVSANTCDATDCTDSVHMVRIGDILDRGTFSMLLMAEYYGLPPASDGWVYMRNGSRVYRVDYATHRVLADVTDQTGPNWF